MIQMKQSSDEVASDKRKVEISKFNLVLIWKIELENYL